MPFLVQEPEDLGSPLSQVLRKLPSIAKGYLEKGEQKKATEMGLYTTIVNSYMHASDVDRQNMENQPTWIALTQKLGMPNKIPVSPEREQFGIPQIQAQKREGQTAIEKGQVAATNRMAFLKETYPDWTTNPDLVAEMSVLSKAAGLGAFPTRPVLGEKEPDGTYLTKEEMYPPSTEAYETGLAKTKSEQAKQLAELEKTKAERVKLEAEATEIAKGSPKVEKPVTEDIHLGGNMYQKHQYDYPTGKWMPIETAFEGDAKAKATDNVIYYRPIKDGKGNITGIGGTIVLDKKSANFSEQIAKGGYVSGDDPRIQNLKGDYNRNADLEYAERQSTATEIGKNIADTYKEVMESGTASIGNLAKYKEIYSLIDIAYTGKLSNVITTLGAYFESVTGSPIKGVKETQFLGALCKGLAVMFIGKGGIPANAFSEKDRQFVEQSTVNPVYTAEANKKLLTVLTRLEKAKNLRAQAYEEYKKNNNGILDSGVEAYSNKVLDEFYTQEMGKQPEAKTKSEKVLSNKELKQKIIDGLKRGLEQNE